MINLNIQSDKNKKRKKEKSLQLKKVLLKSIMLFRANFIRESDSFYLKFFGSSFSCHKVQMQNGKKKKTVEQGAKSFSSLTGLLLRKKEPPNQGFIFPPARKKCDHSVPLPSFLISTFGPCDSWTMNQRASPGRPFFLVAHWPSLRSASAGQTAAAAATVYCEATLSPSCHPHNMLREILWFSS